MNKKIIASVFIIITLVVGLFSLSVNKALAQTVSFINAPNLIAGTSPASVEIGDFNGDGKLDLAAANFSSNNVSILLGTGTGSFGSATNFAAGPGARFVAIRDFNGDGKSDLAVANFYSNTVSILLGTGT
ncbi:MAG TPA: VCBS repeat-containing protein, partial [Patescibacteria group bacterium]|nr:VCBS repeat-containing protein [Patescibacteria group bacterium]